MTRRPPPGDSAAAGEPPHLKRSRRRLARAELVMALATTAETWKRMLMGVEPGVRPFAEWPADDPLAALCRTYRLTPADLARLCDDLGEQLEARAIRIGYDDHLEPR